MTEQGLGGEDAEESRREEAGNQEGEGWCEGSGTQREQGGVVATREEARDLGGEELCESRRWSG